ncbi:hypothetical protein B0I35DRAFT_420829 [Stachybotrys elegans]|uniref:Uncharacterized protein n=1 Tax=Stachybotrys elegans TaxID=80388 RepID=A0A8K0T340_9HYPO|nr:hypothetical protein B0I35DRAFT_420829 [Stachybotrys elegans]
MPVIGNQYGRYVALPGLGTGIILAGYFIFRWSLGDFEGHERGAIIAGAIIGVALILSMGIGAYYAWRETLKLPFSERSTVWWTNIWSRKRQSRAVRQMLDIEDEGNKITDSEMERMNEKFLRNNKKEKSTADHFHDADLESGVSHEYAPSVSRPRTPQDAHLSSKSQAEWRDPNPTSLLNV